MPEFVAGTQMCVQPEKRLDLLLWVVLASRPANDVAIRCSGCWPVLFAMLTIATYEHVPL